MRACRSARPVWHRDDGPRGMVGPSLGPLAGSLALSCQPAQPHVVLPSMAARRVFPAQLCRQEFNNPIRLSR
jgi:hypothetical protein